MALSTELNDLARSAGVDTTYQPHHPQTETASLRARLIMPQPLTDTTVGRCWVVEISLQGAGLFASAIGGVYLQPWQPQFLRRG